jgi:hypothetical protein
MGCGWQPQTTIDMSLFTGAEVINGDGHFLSSIDFWDRELSRGEHLTAIGGSDNHHAMEPPGPGAIGWPTTVVEATELSVPAILDGIRHGRVFIDLTGSHDKVIDLEARDSASQVENEGWTPMGSAIDSKAGESLEFHVKLSACPHSAVHLFLDGHETPVLAPLSSESGTETLSFQWRSDGGTHWLRAEVRDANGSLMLVSNPIYIHPAR